MSLNEWGDLESELQAESESPGEHSKLHTENTPTTNHGHQTTCPLSTVDECGADDTITSPLKWRKNYTTHPFNQPLVANNKKEKGSMRGDF